MADVLNRSTKELRRSQHAPAYDPAEWIINPDLSAVNGVPQSRWIIDGDTVRPPDAGETAAFDAADLAAAKEAKINAINAKTAALVTAGIQVASGKVISTSIAASQNLQDFAISISLGMPSQFPQRISTLDEGVYEIQDLADFARIAALIKAQKKTIMEAGQDLRAQVLAADSLAAVNAVEDSR